MLLSHKVSYDAIYLNKLKGRNSRNKAQKHFKVNCKTPERRQIANFEQENAHWNY